MGRPTPLHQLLFFVVSFETQIRTFHAKCDGNMRKAVVSRRAVTWLPFPASLKALKNKCARTVFRNKAEVVRFFPGGRLVCRRLRLLKNPTRPGGITQGSRKVGG